MVFLSDSDFILSLERCLTFQIRPIIKVSGPEKNLNMNMTK